MDHHNGTTCRSANIWYTSHNMYLIFRVTSMQQNINNIIRIAESTSIIITVNHKRAIYKFICLRLLKHITLITYQKTSSTKIQVSRRTRANNKRLPKWDVQVHTAMTPVICLSRSTPNTK
jgi:hypothetical protein